MIPDMSIQTANDNVPRDMRPDGDSTGFRAMLRDQELERRLHNSELNTLSQSKPDMQSLKTSDSNPHSIKLPLFCTLLATLASAYCFYSSQGLYPCIAALSVMVWASLWTSFQSAKAVNSNSNLGHKDSFMSEACIVAATVAGLGIWGLVSREWGLPLSLADGIFGFAALTVLISALLGSRLTLVMSACAGLAWLAYFTLVPSVSIVSIWIYPILALIQLFIAGQNEGKFAATLTLIGAHAWLFWILSDRFMAGDISLLHVAAFSMMIGMAHYRLGKAAGDVFWETASLHVFFGWSLAMAGAIGIQHYWLGTNTEFWGDVTAPPLSQLSWQVTGAVAIALIGTAGLIRMAHNQMSTMAVLFTLAAAVLAAAVFDQRSLIENYVRSELNMPARPLVGLLIGAAIWASAIAMCVNGARRKSLIMMFAGLAVVAAELALMLDPNIWSAETGLAFGMCLVTSLCFAALFAAEPASSYA